MSVAKKLPPFDEEAMNVDVNALEDSAFSMGKRHSLIIKLFALISFSHSLYLPLCRSGFQNKTPVFFFMIKILELLSGDDFEVP